MLIRKVFCNECGQETRHDQLFEYIAREELEVDEGWQIEYGTTYQMFACRGCDDVVMRSVEWHSEVDLSHPEKFFPPRVFRHPPKWIHGLADGYRSLLEEIYSALHAGCRRLAVMGSRTLLDVYLSSAVGEGGTFAEKLKHLVEKKLASETDRDVLEAALEAGHAVSHRAHAPTDDEVNTTLDIIENLLLRGMLKGAAEDLKLKTPQRQKRSK